MNDSPKTPPTKEQLEEARQNYNNRLCDEIATATLQAELAKLRRDIAVWNQEELEAKFVVHQNTGRIRQLALDLNLVKEEELAAADKNAYEAHVTETKGSGPTPTTT